MLEYSSEFIYLGLTAGYLTHKGLDSLADSAVKGMTEAEIEMTLDPDNSKFRTNRVFKYYLERNIEDENQGVVDVRRTV